VSRLLAIGFSFALLASGCGGGSTESQATATTASTTTSVSGCVDVPPVAGRGNGGAKPPTAKLDPAKTYRLTFVTNCGSFTVTLDQKLAPKTTASLVSLARQGFYDDTVFHRIVPGFVIQGGDPTQTGGGGPGYQTVDRPPASTRYTHGVVAMAKTAAEPPGASGSQFFVVTAPDAQLPADYAVVGKVTAGLPVVDRIGKLGNELQQPTRTIEIEKVKVSES
jgi:peptidyl-prolyl cis-trans isomerase B (cyclophilin B)